MIKYKFIFLALLSLAIFSCGDDEEEMEEMEETCETENLTYTNDISIIMNSTCAANTACHVADATATFSLANFADVTTAVSFGSISGAINQLDGFSPMPRGGDKLDDCTIAMIDQWLDDGAPE